MHLREPQGAKFAQISRFSLTDAEALEASIHSYLLFPMNDYAALAHSCSRICKSGLFLFGNARIVSIRHAARFFHSFLGGNAHALDRRGPGRSALSSVKFFIAPELSSYCGHFFIAFFYRGLECYRQNEAHHRCAYGMVYQQKAASQRASGLVAFFRCLAAPFFPPRWSLPSIQSRT